MPIFAGWTFVDEDAQRAQELGRKYIGRYVETAFTHYQTTGDHMKGLKGYEYYAANAERMKASGVSREQSSSVFVDNHIWGTPDQCFEKITAIREKLGACAFLGVFNYAGMEVAEAKRNQRLFADKVLPRLKAFMPDLDIGSKPLAAAAE